MTQSNPPSPAIAAPVEELDASPPVRWSSADIEQWFGVRGGRYTRTNALFTFFVALLLTIGFYALLLLGHGRLVAMFTERGAVQYVTMLFSFWCLVTLLVKAMKVRLQRRAMEVRLLPSDPTFPLTGDTAPQVIQRLQDACDDPRRFLLFNRVDLALANLRNRGGSADFERVLEAQAANDEDLMESSFSLVRGLIWAIPVLGFIGTVQGLSQAIAGFGSVLAQTADVQAIKPALQGVAGGLATAFETTFVALVAALVLQLILTFVKQSEERLLDDCKDYCQRQLVLRLRFVPAHEKEA